MRQIGISDQTLFTPAARAAGFRQKLEAARKLDHLGMTALETPALSGEETDLLLMRSLSGAVKHSVLSVETGLTPESVDRAWEGIKAAARPRLVVAIPLSSAQMEYVCQVKPAKLPALISALVTRAKALCPDVEFVAGDMTRAEEDFALTCVKAAVAAGAQRVTVQDAAGLSLPEEMARLVKAVREAAGEKVTLCVCCGNELHLAAACAVAALQGGADEIKTACGEDTALSAGAFAHILRARGADLQLDSTLDCTRVSRTEADLSALFASVPGGATPFDGHALSDPGSAALPGGADEAALSQAVRALGYELGEEDMAHVREAVERESKGRGLTRAELEAIILSASQQVPPTYRLKRYLINSGNTITPTAHLTLEKGKELLSGLCAGDGPIDAAFLAIEQIVGQHYELDDFQIASITRNREAMGDALVRLRHQGRIYAGKGTSTDIIAAAIRAYMNALNKIAYEEKLV